MPSSTNLRPKKTFDLQKEGIDDVFSLANLSHGKHVLLCSCIHQITIVSNLAPNIDENAALRASFNSALSSSMSDDDILQSPIFQILAATHSIHELLFWQHHLQQSPLHLPTSPVALGLPSSHPALVPYVEQLRKMNDVANEAKDKIEREKRQVREDDEKEWKEWVEARAEEVRKAKREAAAREILQARMSQRERMAVEIKKVFAEGFEETREREQRTGQEATAEVKGKGKSGSSSNSEEGLAHGSAQAPSSRSGEEEKIMGRPKSQKAGDGLREKEARVQARKLKSSILRRRIAKAFATGFGSEADNEENEKTNRSRMVREELEQALEGKYKERDRSEALSKGTDRNRLGRLTKMYKERKEREKKERATNVKEEVEKMKSLGSDNAERQVEEKQAIEEGQIDQSIGRGGTEGCLVEQL